MATLAVLRIRFRQLMSKSLGHNSRKVSRRNLMTYLRFYTVNMGGETSKKEGTRK
jgi:hypothetical protein